MSRTLVLLLAPFAPHIAEELWRRIGGPYPVHRQAWPAHDPAALVDDEVTLVVQVDGRTRDRLRIPAGLDQERAAQHALESHVVRRHLGNVEPTRVVFVPDRLINLVRNRA